MTLKCFPPPDQRANRENELDYQAASLSRPYQDRNWLDVMDIVEMAVNNALLVETDFSP